MRVIRFGIAAVMLLVSCLSAAAELIYLDQDWNRVSRQKAVYQHAPYSRESQGTVAVTMFYAHSEQPYLTTQGHIDSQGQLVYHGSYTFFHRNGQPMLVGHYDQGHFDGIQKRYDEQGELTTEHTYQNHQHVADQRYQNGQQSERVTYSYDGDWLRYQRYEDDDLRCEHQKKNGEFEGWQRHYYQGQLKNEHFYRGGKLDGEVREYRDGELITLAHYSQGLRHGLSQRYSAEGTLDSEINYQFDKQVGESRFYYGNGDLKTRRVYDQHSEVVAEQRYSTNGRVIFDQQVDAQGNRSERRFSQGGALTSMILDSADPSQWRRKEQYGKGGYLATIELSQPDKRLERRTFYPSGSLKSMKIRNRAGDVTEQHWNKAGTLIYNAVEPKATNRWWEVQEFNDQGQLSSRRRGLPAKEHTITEGYRDGQLKSREESLQRRHHGLQIAHDYYADEVMHIHYRHGKRHGSYQRFNQQGQLLEQGQFEDDQATGRWITYDSRELPIPKAIMSGYHRMTLAADALNSAGQSTLIQHYQRGKLDGDYIFKDGQGNTLIRGQFQQGRMTGHWLIKTSAQGPVLVSTVWGKTPQQGAWVNADFTHQYILRGQFKQGLASGPWLFSRWDGSPWLDGHFNRGEPDGTWYSYAPNGQVQCKMTYRQGQVAGDWLHYQDGQVVWQQHFEPGALTITSSHQDNVQMGYGRDSQGIPSDCYINIKALFDIHQDQ